MEVIRQLGGARSLLQAGLPDQAVGLAWLGQAGFALRHAGRRWLIDPYLSDHLARKYAGTEFPHERMMPPPVNAEEIRELDLVLCSHRHSDHMDPGALPTLAANNPGCRFVVPRAELESAIKIGLTVARLIPANAGDAIRLNDSIAIHVLPSAHETLQVNERGEHHFLGFILKLSGLTLYHSGDCVVYDGLAERLRSWRIDLALLPVNGRGRGVPGNLTFAEAHALCRAARIPAFVPHHFGLFAFNTVDPAELRRNITAAAPGVTCWLPTVECHWLFSASSRRLQQHQP
jgi:L-ascorbate metabolism protein UlaG (beta-lactamase superfamily)